MMSARNAEEQLNGKTCIMITNTVRKVRADAKLEQLDATQRELLHFWFEENFSYYEVVKLAQEKFGLTVGRSTVAAYWKRHIMPQRHQDDAEEVAMLRALPAGDFDAAVLQRVWALAWDALARSHPDIDRAAKLLDIVRKAERHALAVKRLALEERRVALSEKLAAQRQATPAKKRSGAQREARQETSALVEASVARPVPLTLREACEVPNPPRFPGYSEPIRPQAGMSEESTVATGNSERTELAAKAPSCEGPSQGPEEAERTGSSEQRPPGEVNPGAAKEVMCARDEEEPSLRGMTCAQVVAAWGEPQLRGSEMKDFQRFDFWMYHTEAGEKRVYFERGKVSRCLMSAAEKRANLPAKSTA